MIENQNTCLLKVQKIIMFESNVIAILLKFLLKVYHISLILIESFLSNFIPITNIKYWLKKNSNYKKQTYV